MRHIRPKPLTNTSNPKEEEGNIKMEYLYTITVIVALIIAATLFIALHRQTKRADCAEAALALEGGGS